MKKTTMACIVTAVVVLGCVLAIGAATYVGVPKGQIYQAYVTYSDSDTIIIKPGYGECDGHYWENTSDLVYDVNYIPAGEDFIYIYIDDDESDYPYPTICDSTTEPVWSDSKLGWYNGDDRCIGVVWTTSSDATIFPFANNIDQKYLMKNDLLALPLYQATSTTGSWQFVETTAYIPVNAIAVKAQVISFDTSAYISYAVRAYDVQGSRIKGGGFYEGGSSLWVELERGCSRDMEWAAQTDDSFTLAFWGYQIER